MNLEARVKELEHKLEVLTIEFRDPFKDKIPTPEVPCWPVIPHWVFDYPDPPECECECNA